MDRLLVESSGSLRFVAEVASAYGDATQLVYGEETWTFAEHHAAASALALALHERFDVGRESRVAIAMRNYPEFSLTFWATQLLGAIAVPVNAWWQEAETARILDFVRPSVVIADGERVPRVGAWARRTETPLVVTRGDTPLGQVSLDGLLTRYAGKPAPFVEVELDDPSTILFTSGTTGVPKGIVHTHGNHLANLRRTLELADPAATTRPGQLATMPLFHITQLSSLYINAALGAKTVLMHKWNALVAADLIEEHGVTQTAGVPMQVQQLLDIVDEGRDLPSLTSIGIGATAVPPHLPTRIWRTFGGRVAPLTGYGMTETTSSVTSLSGEEFVERPSSVGRPHPFNEVRVLAENQEVPVGGIGEIWVRGPNVTTLEWTRTGTAAVRHSSDFLPTGDLGSLDEEGYLYIVGRSKDMIIRSGENVHSAEVEAALLALPDVAGAAVIGLPHARWGEEVTAIVRLRPQATVDLASVRARLAEQLAYFKVPTRYHVIETDFPATATGKTLKRELRELYADVTPDLHEGASDG